MPPNLETIKEYEESHGKPEELQEEKEPENEEEEPGEVSDRFEDQKKPIFEDENFLELKESPWLISKELEEKIREEALAGGLSVGETFRQVLREGVK
ncbi:MAG: hypothetical protein ABEJ36_03235 [Candidatus Nanosalina sp.]